MKRKLIIAFTMFALTTTAIAGGPAMGSRGKGVRTVPIHRLAKKLGLSDEQVASFKAIEQRKVKQTIELDGKLQYGRYELKSLMQEDRPDRGAIFDKIDELAGLRADQQKVRTGARLDARELLSPEQRELMAELMEKRQQRAGRGGRRGSGGRSGIHAERGRETGTLGDGSDDI